MSVLKNLQNLSDLEFYKCAEKLQETDQETINRYLLLEYTKTTD